ncbi:M23 family metallopeptidase (plasmid) [Coraliomargarita sp. W4R53]
MKTLILRAYRVRLPALALTAVILIGNAVGGRFIPDSMRPTIAVVVLTALGVFILGGVLCWVGPRLLPGRGTQSVFSPVDGRWLGMNSPSSKVPSHGVRGYGQAYAIDLVCEPSPGSRPVFGGEAMRPARDYPAFGQPVRAMVDGTIVRASGWRRDHRARSNIVGVVYLMVEALIRELGGPGFIVGNHVTILGDNGMYACVAHLQRRSISVKVGDRVRAGESIGRCGNSGNSSEPHVHAQLMDRPSLWTSQGVPMAFSAIRLGDTPQVVDALPKNDELMTAAGDPEMAT